MSENYNFHNSIAIPLEIKARNIMGVTDRPVNTIFDADIIESHSFIEVMVLLLRLKSNYVYSNLIQNFIEKCIPYFYVNGNKIDKTIANQLFKNFEQLIDYIEKCNKNNEEID